jgi:hypothetical protein
MVRWLCALVAAVAISAFVVPVSVSAEDAPAPQRRPAEAVLVGAARLHSPDGRYLAGVSRTGRLFVQRAGHIVWSTHGPRAQQARLRLRPSGNLTLRSGRKLLWASGTAGSHATRIILTNAGALVLRSAAGTVWSSAVGNRCRSGPASGRRVSVDLSEQFAWVCAGARQLLTTPVTSGATAHGMGTPTGTWHLQAKQRNRYLYPAAGGAYYVHYWLPYDGAYGLHDSSWQHFPYGSAKYRTRGSHGCIHMPRAAIAWLYAWAPIGTTVQIRR